MKDVLNEWRERWNNGDTKFVSELLDMADGLVERVEKYEIALKEIAEETGTPYANIAEEAMKVGRSKLGGKICVETNRF